MAEEESEPKYVPKPDGAASVATRLVAELKHDRGILACKYDSANQFLFAGARDYFVHRWDLAKEPVLEPPVDPKKKPRYPPVPAAPADSRLELVKHQSWVGGISLFSDGDRRFCRSAHRVDRSSRNSKTTVFVRGSQGFDPQSRGQS